MFCKTLLVLVSFAAFVALEWSFPTMCPQMTLQVTRVTRSEVTLVALVWLFCCVIRFNVLLQMTDFDAGIIAQCASVGLLSRVSHVMSLQAM